MRIAPNNILLNPVISRTAAGAVSATGKTASAPKAAEPKYDTVTIETEDSFQKQLQSKISQEIRTATTTGTITSLREQVLNGEYQVDALNIARRLSLVWEV